MRRLFAVAVCLALTAASISATAEDLVSVSSHAATLFFRATDAPTCPPAGTRGIYYDTSAGELYSIDDACSTVSLEAGGGSGAPDDVKYWVGAPDAGLPNAYDMSALATALVVNTAGMPSAYAGTGACAVSNWIRALSATGVATCTQPLFSDISGSVTDAQVPNTITVDLATTATALAANPADCGANTFAQSIVASGALTCANVTLSTSDVTGTLPYNKGGTGQNLLGIAGQYLKVNAGETGLDYGTLLVEAPTNAEYIVSEANATLSAEVAPSAANQVPVSSSSTAATWGTVPVAAGGTGLTAVGPAYSDLRTNSAANATEWGQQVVVLASPIAVAVNATYVTVFTVQPILSKTNDISFRIYHAASATTIGMQFRVRSADTGNVGICAFTHLGINATVSSSVDVFHVQTAIAAAPADTASLASFSTAFNTVYIDCAFTSDASPGTVILEAQLETGTTSTNILAGSSYTYSFN